MKTFFLLLLYSRREKTRERTLKEKKKDMLLTEVFWCNRYDEPRLRPPLRHFPPTNRCVCECARVCVITLVQWYFYDVFPLFYFSYFKGLKRLYILYTCFFWEIFIYRHTCYSKLHNIFVLLFTTQIFNKEDASARRIYTFHTWVPIDLWRPSFPTAEWRSLDARSAAWPSRQFSFQEIK